MEARYMILARYAEFSTDGMVNIIGGDNDKLIAEEYPYIHQLLISVSRVVLDRDDCDHTHAFNAVVIDDETNDIIAEGVSGTIPPLPIPAEAHVVGIGLLLPFKHVIFPKSGVYVVHLLVDETVLAKARFKVAPIAYYQRVSRPSQSINVQETLADER